MDYHEIVNHKSAGEAYDEQGECCQWRTYKRPNSRISPPYHPLPQCLLTYVKQLIIAKNGVDLDFISPQIECNV